MTGQYYISEEREDSDESEAEEQINLIENNEDSNSVNSQTLPPSVKSKQSCAKSVYQQIKSKQVELSLLASQAAPLMDRIGRMLCDLAPHMAMLGANLHQ